MALCATVLDAFGHRVWFAVVRQETRGQGENVRLIFNTNVINFTAARLSDLHYFGVVSAVVVGAGFIANFAPECSRMFPVVRSGGHIDGDFVAQAGARCPQGRRLGIGTPRILAASAVDAFILHEGDR